MKGGLPKTVRDFEGSREIRYMEKQFMGDIRVRGVKHIFLNARSIEPNPDQPRKNLGDLSELIDSIRKKGILEPIIVRRNGDRYQIVAGERRFKAFLELSRNDWEIPCVVVEADDRQALEISLVENLQRKDLDIWEVSEIFNRMSKELGYTQEEISKRIGKSLGYVSEIMRVARLPLDSKRELSKFENLPQNIALQAVRANKGGKLDEYMEMVR